MSGSGMDSSNDIDVHRHTRMALNSYPLVLTDAFVQFPPTECGQGM